MSNKTAIQLLTSEEFNSLESQKDTEVIYLIKSSDEFLTIKSGYIYALDTPKSILDIKELDLKSMVFILENKEESLIETIAKELPQSKGVFILDDIEVPTDDFILSIDAYEFQLDIKHEKDVTIVDLRKEEECALGYVKGAINIEIKDLESKVDLLKETTSIYLYSGTGKRSLIASSLLKRNDIHHFKNIDQGFKGFEGFEIPINKSKNE